MFLFNVTSSGFLLPDFSAHLCILFHMLMILGSFQKKVEEVTVNFR